MEFEKLAGLIVLGWLIIAVLLMARLVRKGRELAAAFAARHPGTYESLGRPLPGFLQSARRSRFARFIAQREYRNLDDPGLSARFEAYRKAEARLLLLLLASLAVVALLVLIARHAA